MVNRWELSPWEFQCQHTPKSESYAGNLQSDHMSYLLISPHCRDTLPCLAKRFSGMTDTFQCLCYPHKHWTSSSKFALWGLALRSAEIWRILNNGTMVGIRWIFHTFFVFALCTSVWSTGTHPLCMIWHPVGESRQSWWQKIPDSWLTSLVRLAVAIQQMLLCSEDNKWWIIENSCHESSNVSTRPAMRVMLTASKVTACHIC